jgi:hypothetical protein
MEPLFQVGCQPLAVGNIKEQKPDPYQLDEDPQARNTPSAMVRPERRRRASAVGRRHEVPMRLDVPFHYSGENRCL